MALPVTFDHCVTHVSDWERSNAFYRDVLGAELVRRPRGWAYRFGNVQLNLHGPGVTPAEVARLPVQPGNSDLCFEWRGPIADAIAHLERCGVAILAGPIQRFGAKGPGTNVPNPKFAQPFCNRSCELRIQRDISKCRLASVALVQKFAPDPAAKYGELLNRHTGVYFRDPDGSLLEFMSYRSRRSRL